MNLLCGPNIQRGVSLDGEKKRAILQRLLKIGRALDKLEVKPSEKEGENG